MKKDKFNIKSNNLYDELSVGKSLYTLLVEEKGIPLTFFDADIITSPGFYLKKPEESFLKEMLRKK